MALISQRAAAMFAASKSRLPGVPGVASTPAPSDCRPPPGAPRHQQRLTLGLQHLADEAPDTPVTDEDGVAGKQVTGNSGRVAVAGGAARSVGTGRLPPLALDQPGAEAIDEDE
jgi:hypothetical protein